MAEIEITVALKEHIENTLDVTNTYLATFSSDGILSLFENGPDRSKYLERYSEFALKLSGALSVIEGDVAAISRLITEYEASRSPEETAKLCSLFEACEAFFIAAAKFINENEDNFRHKDSFSPAHTLRSARELKTAAQLFSEKTNG